MANQIASFKMEQKFKNTPAGRIPVDWDVRSLKSLAKEMLNGGTPNTKIEGYWEGDIPWITGADFLNQKVPSFRRHITREAVENSTTNIVPKGSVLVVTRTGVGKLAIAPCDVAISQDITGIVPVPEVVTPAFLFWVLNLYASQLKAAHQGTSIYGILRADLENLSLPLPPMMEQKKIAEILFAVDDAIAKVGAVIEKISDLKAALVQNFYAEVSGDSRWQTSSVGACAQINHETLGEKTNPDTSVRYIDISSIERTGIVASPRELTFVDAPSRARRVVRQGDILVSTVRPYLRAFARVDLDSSNLIASTGFAVLTPQPNVDGDFLYQFILSDRFVKFLQERMVGSNYPAVNSADVAMCPMPLPPIEQQNKISRVLAEMDRLLLREDESHRQLVAAKRATMQVLLTGRVRAS